MPRSDNLPMQDNLSLDLPEPPGPMRLTRSPFSILKDMSFRRVAPPNDILTPSKEINVDSAVLGTYPVLHLRAGLESPF